MFLAAEGAADLGSRGADVDIGDAAVRTLVGKEALGRAHALGEDRRRQTLVDRVVHRYSLVEGLILEDIEDRGEGLLARDLHAGLRLDDGGFDKEPLAVRPAAAAENLAPLLADGVESREVVVHRALVDQRAHEDAVLQRITDGDAGVGLDQTLDHLRCDALLQEEAPQAGAPLAGSPHRGKEDGAQGEVEIGVVRDDDRVVAAELEDAAAKTTGGGLGDVAAHLRGTGKGNQWHPLVIDQALADAAAGTDDEVEDALQIVAFHHPVADVLDGDRSQRRVRGRLPDHGAATDGGQGGVPGPYGNREVEGRNDAHYAERMPLLVQAMARALRCHVWAIELARQTDREVAHVDHFLDLAEAFREDLAHLQ